MVTEKRIHKHWLYMKELVIRVADKMDKERCEARKKAKQTRIIDTGEFYNEFCCVSSDVKRWRSEGMPCIKGDGGYFYDVEQCHAWFRGEL